MTIDVIDNGKYIHRAFATILIIMGVAIPLLLSSIKYADVLIFFDYSISLNTFYILQGFFLLLAIALIYAISRVLDKILFSLGLKIRIGDYVELEVQSRNHLIVAIPFQVEINRRKLIRELKSCKQVIRAIINNGELSPKVKVTAITGLLTDTHAKRFGLYKKKTSQFMRVKNFILWYAAWGIYRALSQFRNHPRKISTPRFKDFKSYAIVVQRQS